MHPYPTIPICLLWKESFPYLVTGILQLEHLINSILTMSDYTLSVRHNFLENF